MIQNIVEVILGLIMAVFYAGERLVKLCLPQVIDMMVMIC